MSELLCSRAYLARDCLSKVLFRFQMSGCRACSRACNRPPSASSLVRALGQPGASGRLWTPTIRKGRVQHRDVTGLSGRGGYVPLTAVRSSSSR